MAQAPHKPVPLPRQYLLVGRGRKLHQAVVRVVVTPAGNCSWRLVQVECEPNRFHAAKDWADALNDVARQLKTLPLPEES